MNETLPIAIRKPGIPTAPPPPELPADIPGIAHAIEAMLDAGPPARMGQAYHGWLRRIPGLLMGAQEQAAIEMAAIQRVSASRERTINLLTGELATERGELAEARLDIIAQQECRQLWARENAYLSRRLARRWHPAWVLAWGAALGVGSVLIGWQLAIHIDVWEPVVARAWTSFHHQIAAMLVLVRGWM